VSATAEGQERWRLYYEAAALRSGDRALAGTLIQRLEMRRFWQRLLAVASTVLLAGMTVFFYTVLTR
jgi:hypothetical protein